MATYQSALAGTYHAPEAPGSCAGVAGPDFDGALDLDGSLDLGPDCMVMAPVAEDCTPVSGWVTITESAEQGYRQAEQRCAALPSRPETGYTPQHQAPATDEPHVEEAPIPR